MSSTGPARDSRGGSEGLARQGAGSTLVAASTFGAVALLLFGVVQVLGGGTLPRLFPSEWPSDWAYVAAVVARVVLLHVATGMLVGLCAGGLVLLLRSRIPTNILRLVPSIVVLSLLLGILLQWELRQYADVSLRARAALAVALIPAVVGVGFGFAAVLGRLGIRFDELRRITFGTTLVVVATSGSFWAVSLLRQGGAPLSPPRTNVILISLDTVRADHLGLYGYERDTTPALEERAETAVVFERAFAPEPWTLPSHMTMMTSLPPLAHGVTAIESRLNPAVVTLAEALASAEYRTVAFVARDESSYIGASHGFGDGFDSYQHPPHYRARTLGTRLGELLEKLRGRSSGSAEDITDAALDFLRSGRQEPFFMFLHFYDAHSDQVRVPYEAPDGLVRLLDEHERHFDGCDDSGVCASTFLANFARCPENGLASPADWMVEDIVLHYDAGIRHIDGQLRRIFEYLEASGLEERTLVIVTADHGEAFHEHGRFLHTQLYREVLQVPLIMWFPGGEHSGARVSMPVELADLMPTILDALGVAAPEAAQGRSLLPMVRGEELAVRDLFFSNTEQMGDYRLRELGMLSENRKVILEVLSTCGQAASDAGSGSYELYDVESDPLELRRLSPHEDDELLARLRDWREQTRALEARFGAGESSDQLLTPELRQRLESLGYVSR